jgi:putative transposase
MSSAELPIEHMCALAGVSRRGFYRFDPEAQPAERDMELRDAIQRIALEMPSYGRPRITAELRRRGWVVNAKRFIALCARIICSAYGAGGPF